METETKLCPKCKVVKSVESFPLRWADEIDRSAGGRKSWCRDCCNESTANSTLKSQFNLSREDYNRMLAVQDGRCAICGKLNKKSGRIIRLGVDHCHQTGENRGLLSNKCNVVLGHVNDSPELLRAFIDYLSRYSRGIPAFVILFLFFVSSCFAQSTSVTLQVTDAGGQSWNNGSWSVLLVTQIGAPAYGPPFNIVGNGTVPNQSQNGSLNGTGGASLTVTPNASIVPSLSQWQFKVCPAAGIPFQCFVQSFVIAGASQTVTMVPSAVTVNCGPGVNAYADSEVSCGIGGEYYNTASGGRTCTTATGGSCTAWASTGVGSLNNATLTGTTTVTGALVAGQVNGAYVVDGTKYTTIQSAVTAACAANPAGIVEIPATYAGTDSFTLFCTNGQTVIVRDLRGGYLRSQALQRCTGTLTATAASGGALQAGTYYVFVVPVDGDNGEGQYCTNPIQATVAGVLLNQEIQLTLSTAVPGAVKYRAYYGTVSGLPTEVAEFTGLTYTILGPTHASPATLTGTATGDGTAKLWGDDYYAKLTCVVQQNPLIETVTVDGPSGNGIYTQLANSQTNTTSIVYTWSAVSGCVSYRLYLNWSSAGNFRQFSNYVDTGNVTSFSWKGPQVTQLTFKPPWGNVDFMSVGELVVPAVRTTGAGKSIF